MGKTAWHLAVGESNVQLLRKKWEWVEEKLTTEEVNNKLLLGTDITGRTAWHLAAENGN
jgi:ankyrin repeat protein